MAIRGLLVAVAALAASPAWAKSSVRTPHVTVALVAETSHPAAGRPFWLAIDIHPKPGWHIYWENPGGSGLAPQADWTLPRGLTAGPLLHPTPSLLTVQGVASNVHDGRAVLLDRINVASGLPTGAPATVKASFNWLVCTVGECVPEQAELGVRLAVGGGKADPAAAALISDALGAMPRPLAAPVQYQQSGRRFSLLAPITLPTDLASAHVFLRQAGVIEPGAAQALEPFRDGVAINTDVGDSPPEGRIDGVLRIDRKNGATVGYAFSAEPVAATAASAGSKPLTGAILTFVLALGGAVAGGLILNLMPCVFPILSLKALALARSGGDGAEARREAIGYTLGAVSVLTALGGVLLAMRAGGASAGWAFQLQNPHVVALLLVLCVGIALNLAGLFELPAIGGGLRIGGGMLGSAATGALAAFVATPCTGPFMAGALGSALLLPVPAALAVFAGLGLGLALPFLAISFSPRLRGLMPRPGRWMQTLRRLLSLPMFATALALAWVLGRQAGVAAMTLGLSAALLLGLGLWWRGATQARGHGGWLPTIPLIAAIALAFVPVATPRPAAAGGAGALAAEPYSASRLDALRAAHTPVFVYLTADWCLTCKVNEATSLSSDAVARAFAAAHVAVLEGDWTRGDAEVTRLLTDRRRAGVPLYLFYPAQGGARELPQVLTPNMLVDVARRA